MSGHSPARAGDSEMERAMIANVFVFKLESGESVEIISVNSIDRAAALLTNMGLKPITVQAVYTREISGFITVGGHKFPTKRKLIGPQRSARNRCKR